MFRKKLSMKPQEQSGLLLGLGWLGGITSTPQRIWKRLLQIALIVALTVPFMSTTVATAAVPPNFEDTLITSVSGPTDLTWTPDGRMLIIGKGGEVRVYANGALLPTPALDLSARLCTVGEQGLVGIVVHPNFAANHFIYLYYIYNKFNNTCPESEIDGPVGRFSRFTLPDTNVIDPASELVLFETPPRYRNHHTGGDPKFGKDGYIYLTVGDAGGQTLGWPQNLGILAGKLVRITDTGGIPSDNPFTGPGTARCNVGGIPPAGSPAGTKCQEIYASGLRNPFRMAMDPNASGVRFYINDVGQHTWEEISEGPVSGANYGWQVREGPCAKDSDIDCGLPPAGMNDPIHWYHHGVDGGAVTAGAFVPNGVWPASYDSTYLFSDYVFGKIYQLVPNGGGCRLCSPPTSGFNQIDFADITQVVSMRFGPYGTGQALYYATRNGSEIRRIAYTGTLNRNPVASAVAEPTFGSLPLTVGFDATKSSDPDGDPLTYEWDFENNGIPDSTAVAPTHQYTVAGVYFAKLTVRDGKGGENSMTLRIDAGNTPPNPTIETPTFGTLFAVGQHFILHGSATDSEDGSLSNSSLSWQVLLHHATHTHPFLEATTGNDLEIIAPQPEDLDAASTSYLEILLTATDSNGLTTTVSRELRPKFVDVTFQTSPPGLQLTVSGNTITGPAAVRSWEAANLSVNAQDQVSSGTSWVFSSWSDGGAAAHTITTPASATTYTATFTAVTTQVLTFTPNADAYIDAGAPTANFGSTPALFVDNSPLRNILLKFNVTGIGSNSVSSVKLRLYCLDGSSSGGNFYQAANNSTWTEGTVTWNNAPATVGNSVASLGSVAAGTWYEIDLTSLVTGDGSVSLRVTSLSSNGADYSSKEGTAGFAPQLVVTLGGTSGPTSTPTGTSTSAPTNTPTLTMTPSPTGTLPPTPTSTLTATQTPTGTPGSGLVTFVPVADSYVRDSKPNNNYGNALILRADASPIDRSYLRFNVQGLNSPVSRATLRIFAASSSSQGYQVRGVSDNTWGELTINYNNAPAIGNVLGSSGAIAMNTWISVDITPYITGNGLFSLALTTTSTTAMSFSSNQGANPPQLVVETQSGPTNTPTMTPTATATRTPTNTPTFTPTATATNPNSPTNTPTPTATMSQTPTPTQTNTGTTSSFTFIPIGDSYVDEASPARNFGSGSTLRTDNSPIVRSYLRFNVQGLSGSVTKATLRVFANSASSVGCSANSLSNNTWTESTITYDNAPPVGAVLGSTGPFSAGVWLNINVTGYITGNSTYNLGLTTASGTAISFASREAGANAPQLIIETTP